MQGPEMGGKAEVSWWSFDTKEDALQALARWLMSTGLQDLKAQGLPMPASASHL